MHKDEDYYKHVGVCSVTFSVPTWWFKKKRKENDDENDDSLNLNSTVISSSLDETAS